ncbi:MAG: DUF2934 domain-containing protein [Chlorobiaceae bacterium]|nr:DUF2934 domain-containing protein [Chlorobiaceae bacterium]
MAKKTAPKESGDKAPAKKTTEKEPLKKAAGKKAASEETVKKEPAKKAPVKKEAVEKSPAVKATKKTKAEDSAAPLEIREEHIRIAAYYRWEQKGRQHGSHEEDWLEAEESITD